MITDFAAAPVGTPVTATPLVHNTGNQTTAGIWRVEGPQGTAILKRLSGAGDGGGRWEPGQSEEHWNYWRREYLAYRSGFTADYLRDSDIRAPRLLEAVDGPDGSVELWLEDVRGDGTPRWTPQRLGDFAGQLGAVQARAASLDPPSWLSRRWLRQYAGRFTTTGAVDWHHRAVAPFWPEQLRDGLKRLWENRLALFDLAERLPSTVCHLDVWPMNLLPDDDRHVLIDWAFTGHGAIGEDIGNLIPDTIADGLVETARFAEITEVVTESYIAGLRDGGWRGRPQDVRLAIATTGAAKYVWLAPMMLQRLHTGGSVGSADYDQDSDDSQILRRRAVMFDTLTTWAEQALNR